MEEGDGTPPQNITWELSQKRMVRGEEDRRTQPGPGMWQRMFCASYRSLSLLLKYRELEGKKQNAKLDHGG